MHEKNRERIIGNVESMEHESPVGEFPFADEASYRELVAELEAEMESAAAEELPAIDVDLDAFSEDTQDEIIDMQADYFEGVDSIEYAGAESKLELIKSLLARLAPLAESAKSAALAGLEFVDLDTPEKAMEAAIEIVPMVGGTYAVTGKKLNIQRDPKTGSRTLSLKDLTVAQRLIYAAGEFVASGHIANGIYKSALKKGFGVTAMKTLQNAALRAKLLLVKRVHSKIDDMRFEREDQELSKIPGDDQLEYRRRLRAEHESRKDDESKV